MSVGILRGWKALHWIFKLLIFVAVLAGAVWGRTKLVGGKVAVSYQTMVAERGTLVVSVTASGSISSGNDVNITTNVSGTVNRIYVKNGDKVTQGQKIAEITLDQSSEQKKTAAWASYLSAQNQLNSSVANYNSLQAAAFSANQKFINGAAARGLAASDPTYIQEYATWLQAEANYKNQAGVVASARASLSNTWINYQQTSPTITAPIAGVVSNLVLAPGISISASTGSSTNTTSAAQIVGTITKADGGLLTTVNVSEIDATKVLAGQKVTLTMDAFPGKTFTGKVLIVNTNGQVSSGVTTYPTTIVFDKTMDNIYPNMGVSAKIITKVVDDVILVPTAAISTVGGQNSVRVVKDGKLETVTVEIGEANDTQTVIVSGLGEGDSIVTSASGTASTTRTTTGASPFGTLGGNRGFPGGGPR